MLGWSYGAVRGGLLAIDAMADSLPDFSFRTNIVISFLNMSDLYFDEGLA